MLQDRELMTGGGILRTDVDPVLLKLDDLLLGNAMVEMLSPTIGRLLRELVKSPTLAQAWQPLGKEILDINLPADIVSAWLFALRGVGSFPTRDIRTVGSDRSR